MVVIPKPTSLLVLIITTVVKVFLALYLIKQSKMIDNQLIYSLGQENLLDVLKSSIAFIGIGLSILSDFLNFEFLKYGDIVAGVIIAIFIIKSGFEIMSDSISNILGKSADEEVIKRFRTLIKSIDGVEKIEWVDIVKQGPCYLVLATILVDKTITIDAAHDIATLVDQALMATNEVIYSSIHVEPTED
jgi:cation diffusion facilitator family transporter